MKKTYTLPIVGSAYHPPATEILSVIPLKTPLILRADPKNRFDPNAIGIWISKSHSIIKTVLNPEEYHLGFIPRDLAKALRRKGFPIKIDIPGEFYLNKNGNQPHVLFEIEIEE